MSARTRAGKLDRLGGRNFGRALHSLLGAGDLFAQGLYTGRPIEVKTRAELLATLKPNMLKHLREDCGDLPEEELARRAAAKAAPAAEAATV